MNQRAAKKLGAGSKDYDCAPYDGGARLCYACAGG